MYFLTSEVFNENISGDSRCFIAKISKLNKDNGIIEELSTDIKTIQYHGSSVNEDTITLGSTVAAYIEVEMAATKELLENEEIKLEIGLSLPDEEYIPVGYFTVEKPNTSNGITKFTAYDRMLKFNKSVNVNSFPVRENYTAASVLEMLGSAVGVKIIVPEELKDKKYGLLYRWRETYTYRDAVSYFASYYGYFTIINRDGELEFKWYKDNKYKVGTDRYFAFEKSDIAYKVGRLECTTGNSEDTAQVLTSGTGFKGISFYNPIMTQNRLNTLYNELGGMVYQPSSVDFIGDIRLDVGDIITVTDEKGLIHLVPVMKLTFTFDGGLATTVEAVGESDAEAEVEFAGPTEVKIERIITKVNGINLLVAEKADITQLNAITAEIGNLSAKAITTDNFTSSLASINTLTSQDAIITNIKAQVLNVDSIKAAVADVGYITVEKADLKYLTTANADIKYLTTEKADTRYLTTASADIKYLTAEKADLKYLTSQSADIKYADIGMTNVSIATMGQVFANTGLITSATIKDGHITGFLDSVEVNANKITAGTLAVDRLVIRGSEKSIVYELNNITGALQSKSTNTINGEVLTKRTINCDKIVTGTITANEIAAGTITADKLNVNSVSAAVANVITLNASKITSGTISADRIDINSLFAKHITSTGGISTTGTYAGNITFKNTISGGVFRTYVADEELARITPIKKSDTERYFSILLDKATALSLGTGASGDTKAWYFMNNGGNPRGITQRHQFIESVYIEGSLSARGSISAGNSNSSYGYKVTMWSDSEGGNIEIISADGKYGYQMDACGNNFRVYCFETSPWKYLSSFYFTKEGKLGAPELYEKDVSLKDRYAALSHTHNYLPLTGGTLSGGITVTGTVKASGANRICGGDKIFMWTDNEGGNIEITSNTGTTSWQQDALGDVFRIYQHNKTTGANYFPISMSGNKVTINTLNVSNTLNGYNIGGSVTKNNNGLITGGNVYNALGNIQIVEILTTGLLSTGATVTNGTTAVLSTSFEMWEGSTNYFVIPITFRYCSIESISVSGSNLNITVRNTSGASHTLSASFRIIYYKYK